VNLGSKIETQHSYGFKRSQGNACSSLLGTWMLQDRTNILVLECDCLIELQKPPTYFLSPTRSHFKVSKSA